jgi:hypothetical protein
MPTKKPYLRYLSSNNDLVTPYEAVRAGFVSLALERNRRATPFVEQARTLKTYASQARTPTELTKIENIQSALLTATGISEKAATHLQPDDKKEAIEGLIANFLEPSGADFVEELVFRFLLTRGDTLGGSMRNAGGALAQRKLTRTILSTLRLARIKQSFDAKGVSPKIFFIGAAIERKMSGEIWQMLENGYLSNAANLTNHSQLASIVLWLCNL